MTKRTERTIAVCVLLAMAIFTAYWPSISANFVYYDDPAYVTENPYVRLGLNWPNVVWAFNNYTLGNWHPLTWLSHMLVVQLFGLEPAMHHLANIALHIANSALLLIVLDRMTGAFWRSALVAALFALHPMHVESVAWIAERKDVLSTFFFMLMLWAYVRYVESVKCQVSGGKFETRNPKAESNPKFESQKEGQSLLTSSPTYGVRNAEHARLTPKSEEGGSRNAPHFKFQVSSFKFLLLSVLFFACGLMSKGMLVTVPFILLLLDFWPLGRGSRVEGQVSGVTDQAQSERSGLKTKNQKLKALLPLLLETIPFFALSAVASVVTFHAQKTGGALEMIANLSLGARIENALVSYCRYLGKLFWPVHLSAFYPHPGHWPFLTVALAGLLLLGISAAVFLRRREQPSLLVGWLWFVGSLVPVIGIVQAGLQGIADRYTYLPYIGLFIAIAWVDLDFFLGKLLKHLIPSRDRSPTPLKQGVNKTRNRAGIAGQVGAAIPVVGLLVALGTLTNNQARYWRDTRTLFEHAVAVTPDNAVARNNLGGCLMAAGESEAAKRQYAEAVRLQPNYRTPLENLANCIAANPEGWAEATVLYQRALKIEGAPSTHYNYACMLLRKGDFAEGEAHLRTALRLKPDYLQAHYNLGLLKYQQHKNDEAVQELTAALQFQTNFAPAQLVLGKVLAEQQKWDEAVAHLRTGLELMPGQIEGHKILGVALVSQGKFSEAIPDLQIALQAAPDARTHYYFALALHAVGQFDQALAHYREAVRLEPEMADYLNDLAWLLATCPKDEVRNGPEAVRIAEKACRLRDKEARFWGTLDAAYAEAGRFGDAIATAQKTRDLAVAAGQKDLADAAEKRLELYKSHKPYHLPYHL